MVSLSEMDRGMQQEQREKYGLRNSKQAIATSRLGNETYGGSVEPAASSKLGCLRWT